MRASSFTLIFVFPFFVYRFGLVSQEERKADEKAKAARLRELDKAAKAARRDLVAANKERRREAHERVLKCFVVEEAEAEEGAGEEQAAEEEAAGCGAPSARSDSNQNVSSQSASVPGGAGAWSAAVPLRLVPLRGAAVDRCLALGHFLLAFAQPLKLRRLPHWAELHAAVHAVAGHAPLEQVHGGSSTAAAAGATTDGAGAAALAAAPAVPLAWAAALLTEVAVALTACARKDHQPSLLHAAELAEARMLLGTSLALLTFCSAWPLMRFSLSFVAFFLYLYTRALSLSLFQ
jgi:hypothetical protein